jgi:antitoxin component YwqK of YwqJK toxin-antitoxin module
MKIKPNHKMKRILLLTFTLIFLLIACNEKLTEVVDVWYEDGTPQKVSFYKTEKGYNILVKSIEYHSNQSIFIEGGYKNGKREGEWKSWYDNGTLWSVGTFKQDVQVGQTLTYYENGNLRYSGNYDEKGNRTGKWLFYDENNNLLETIEY